MGGFIKWLLIILAALLGLLIAVIVVVLLVVDPNDYRDDIAQAVEQQTGREMSIEGDLGLTFFPWFGLEIGRTQIADAEGFGPEPFATIDGVRLAVNVMPLLSGDLQLDTIVLESPSIRLIRDKNGRANWEQFPAAQSTKEAPTGEGESSSDGLPEIVRTLRLKGLVINNASVVYADRATDTGLTLAPLNLTLENVRFGEPVPFESDWKLALGKGPSVTGQLEGNVSVAADLGSASVNPVDLSLTASGEDVPNGEQTVELSARLDADLARSRFTAKAIELTAAGATLNASAEGRMADSGPQIAGNLEIPEFSPRGLLEQLGIEPPATRDEDTLEALSADAEFRFADGAATVEPLTLQLDDSRLTGEATVSNLGAVPATEFQLAVDQLDADRYLPAADESPEEGDDETTTNNGGEARIPTQPLRQLDVNGKLTVGKLTIAGADLTDIDISINAKDGRVRVHPLAATLYQGRYSGDIRLDATGPRLGVAVDERLDGIQAEPLLADFADFDRLLGQGDFSITANASGETVAALLDGLKGEALFNFSDGSIRGLNIAQMLRRGMARFRGQEVDDEAPPKTDFTTLAGTVRIDGGNLSNDDLSLKTPLLRISGEGSANIIKRTVDYLLTINVVGSLEGQGGENLSELKSIPVPLKISGALASPSINLALTDTLKDAANARLEAEKAELEAKAKQKLDEEKKQLQDKVDKQKKALREKGDKKEKELREKTEKALGDKLKGMFE